MDSNDHRQPSTTREGGVAPSAVLLCAILAVTIRKALSWPLIKEESRKNFAINKNFNSLLLGYEFAHLFVSRFLFPSKLVRALEVTVELFAVMSSSNMSKTFMSRFEYLDLASKSEVFIDIHVSCTEIVAEILLTQCATSHLLSIFLLFSLNLFDGLVLSLDSLSFRKHRSHFEQTKCSIRAPQSLLESLVRDTRNGVDNENDIIFVT